MKNNPEQKLIDLLADQIQDDERVLDGLGSGTLSLEELQEWRQRRWYMERRFLQESSHLLDQMQSEGFGKTMRHSDMQRFGMARPKRKGNGKTALAAAAKAKKGAKTAASSKSAEPTAARFSLDLADLGLPCALHVAGTYDDVLDAGIYHARHVHHLRGSADSVMDTVKSAIVEHQTTELSTAERYPGKRSEEQVSDEAANQTRSSGLGFH